MESVRFYRINRIGSQARQDSKEDLFNRRSTQSFPAQRMDFSEFENDGHFDEGGPEIGRAHV